MLRSDLDADPEQTYFVHSQKSQTSRVLSAKNYETFTITNSLGNVVDLQARHGTFVYDNNRKPFG